MELDDFKSWMYGQALSSVTIDNYHRYLRQIQEDIDLDEVENNYKIAEFLYKFDTTIHQRNNIAKAINKYLEFKEIDYSLKLKSYSGEDDTWIPKPDQVDKILEVRCWGNRFHNEKNHLYLRTTVEAGLRLREARELRFQDIKRKEKKGSIEHYVHIRNSKGDKSRVVPISPELFDNLQTYEKYYSVSDVVFPNPKGETLANNTLRKYCYQAAKHTEDRELIDNLHPHSLRHYRAVELLDQGVSLEAIRRFLGHASLETTKRYLSGDRDFLLNELQNKDSRFSGGEKNNES